MNPSSPHSPEMASNPDATARKAAATLRKLLQQDVTQVDLSRLTGLEKTKVHRVCKDIEPFMRCLHYLGFKMVSRDKQCFDPDEVELMFKAYKRMVSESENAADYFGLESA